MQTAALREHTYWETMQARIMFFLALVFLIFLGGVLHRHRLPESLTREKIGAAHLIAQTFEAQATAPSGVPLGTAVQQLAAVGLVGSEVFAPQEEVALEQTEYIHEVELTVQLVVLGTLWPFFLIDAVIRLFQRGRGDPLWRHLGHSLLVCLFPPARMGTKSARVPGTVWLPVWGWRRVDRDLFNQLERLFSIPMIFIALLVLPLMGVQYGWEHTLHEHPSLHLFLEVGNALVWVAFALEFLLMASVADKKLAYAVQHWIDIVIIVLPFVEFLPIVRALRAARIFRLLRLDKLARLSRLYRLRGVYMRAWRAFLVLDLIRRLTGRSLEARLQKLEEVLAAKEEEVDQIRREILDIKEKIARKKAEAEAAATPPPQPAATVLTGTAEESPPPPQG